jgi:SpoVK/Ycf46/Vps4 family AAA+-type ATPase
MDDDYWNGIKTILIIGPEGSGKTSILESVRNYAIELSNMNKCSVMFLSSENILDYSHDKFKQFDNIYDDLSIENPNQYINKLIITLYKVLGEVNTKCIQNANQLSDKPILILIDNLNDILLASEESDIGYGKAMKGGLNYQIVAVYLRRLLIKINDRHVSNRKILIIGTTSLSLSTVYAANNFPDFDSYLSIPRPTSADRQMLLTFMIKQNSILQNVEIDAHSYVDDLANLTRGYLPGDLAAVVRRIASTHCGNLSTGKVLDWSKVLSAVASMPPKQLQALDMLSGNNFGVGSGDIKSLCWDDFAGYNDIKKKLIQILSTKTSKIQNASMPHGILLHGSSGCGKTFLAKVIAAESNKNFVYVRSTEILSKNFGETEETLRKLFEKARAAAPCVLFFDEFDALAFKRGLNGDQSSSDAGHSLHNRVLSTFLNEMDGIVSLDDGSTEGGVLVLAACNDIGAIDEGLLRPGRFQYHIKLKPPTPDDIHDILERYLSKINCSFDISISEIVTAFLAKIASPSAAEIGSLCKAAIFVALQETINSGNETIIKVCGKHFLAALHD